MSWDSHYKRAERGPWGFIVSAIVIIFTLFVLAFVLGIFGRGCSLVNEAASVAQAELGPRALLKKYEWFKNAAAVLDKKVADIRVYEARIAHSQKQPRRDRWVEDRIFQWETELLGIKASYNGLAAEYNAQMSKINWAFTNIGSLPAGATEPLPREFKPYTTE